MIWRARLFGMLMFLVLALLYIWGLWVPKYPWVAKLTTSIAFGMVYHYGRGRARRERAEFHDRLERMHQSLQAGTFRS
jgi:Flp pilus assembly protein TadB